MKRRQFVSLLGGAAATWPLVARGQLPAVPVIGFLSPGSADSQAYMMEGFSRGLSEAGYVQGRNVMIEYRWAEGQYDRLSEFASELVRRPADVIVAAGSSAPGLAAKAATSMIPIVFQTGADPVADGLVASMNHPGGNITGVSRMTVALDPKRIELLHEVVPKAIVLGLLVSRDSSRAGLVIEQVQKAAGSLGLTVATAKVGAEDELESAFATMVQEGTGALLVANDPVMQRWMDKIVALTMRHALPAMFTNRPYVMAGGLMSYDSSITDSFRQVGVYVGRILKGEKPSDLPIQQPTKFELIINLKTAKALGLTVPLTLQASADELIE